MSLAPSLKLTNLRNKFTVNSFFPYLRLTVKIFQFLRLSTKFLAVLRLSVNPIKTLLYVYLTIIPRARICSAESIAIDSEAMGARGIIVLVKSN